jgi:hypothetical protein
VAFCHIEKAAGTSLIGALRKAFAMQFAALRPLSGPAGRLVNARDLELVRRLNPWIRCVAGHAVVPHAGLQNVPDLRFITLLRDPVARAASQYRFWVQRMGSTMSPEEYLAHPASANLQVRKIAGREDADLARHIIERHFMLVGVVEQFDEFMVLLADRLGLPAERFAYARKNVGEARGPISLPAGFEAALAERNRSDIELYDWVSETAMPAFRAQASVNLDKATEAFRLACEHAGRGGVREWLDLAYRNAYIKPATGLIRCAHGLNYAGTYAVRRGERY